MTESILNTVEEATGKEFAALFAHYQSSLYGNIYEYIKNCYIVLFTRHWQKPALMAGLGYVQGGLRAPTICLHQSQMILCDDRRIGSSSKFHIW